MTRLAMGAKWVWWLATAGLATGSWGAAEARRSIPSSCASATVPIAECLRNALRESNAREGSSDSMSLGSFGFGELVSRGG